MEDPNAVPTLMDEEEIRRLQRVQRHAWGATFIALGFFVLICFVVGLLVFRWFWGLAEGSPTIK